jgi:hypothetical protein
MRLWGEAIFCHGGRYPWLAQAYKKNPVPINPEGRTMSQRMLLSNISSNLSWNGIFIICHHCILEAHNKFHWFAAREQFLHRKNHTLSLTCIWFRWYLDRTLNFSL